MSTFYSMESRPASDAGMAADGGGGGGEDDTAASRDVAAAAVVARGSSAAPNDNVKPPPPSGLPAAGVADAQPRSKPLSFFGGRKSSSGGKKEAAAPPGGPMAPPGVPPAAASRLPEAARPDAPLAARAAFIVTSVGQLCLGPGAAAFAALPPPPATAALLVGPPSASPPPASPPRLLASWVVTASQLRGAARLAAEVARDVGGSQDVNMNTTSDQNSSKLKGDDDGDGDGDDNDIDGPEFSAAPSAAFAVASPSFGGIEGRAPPQWRLLLRVRPGARQADVALLLNEGATAAAADAAAARAAAAAASASASAVRCAPVCVAGAPIMSDASSFASLVGCTARVEAAVVVRAAAAPSSAAVCGGSTRGSLQRAFFAGANAEAGFAGARLRLPDEWGLAGLVSGLAGGGDHADDEEMTAAIESKAQEQKDDDDGGGGAAAAAAAAAAKSLRALAVAQASEPAVVVSAVLYDVDRVSLAPGAADADHAAGLATLVRLSPAAGDGGGGGYNGGGGGGNNGGGGLLPRLVGVLSAAKRRAGAATTTPLPSPDHATQQQQQQQEQQQRYQTTTPPTPPTPPFPPPPSSARTPAAPAPPSLYGVRVPSAVRARLERALSPRRPVLVSRSPLMLVADGVLDPEVCSLLCGAAASSGALARSRVAHGGETPSRTSRSYFFQKAEALRALALQADREILAFARAAAARAGRGPATPVATCFAAAADDGSLSLGAAGGGGGVTQGRDQSGDNIIKRERALARAEQLQVIQYCKDDFYRAHYDHRVGVTLVRNATVLVYLCDTPRGGATWFPNATPSGAAASGLLDGVEAGGGGGGSAGGGNAGGGVRVFPRRGRALIFWSTHADGVQDDCSLHSAEEVLEGQKWLASRWLRSE